MHCEALLPEFHQVHQRFLKIKASMNTIRNAKNSDGNLHFMQTDQCWCKEHCFIVGMSDNKKHSFMLNFLYAPLFEPNVRFSGVYKQGGHCQGGQ